jgi:hypothetical protein
MTRPGSPTCQITSAKDLIRIFRFRSNGMVIRYLLSWIESFL